MKVMQFKKFVAPSLAALMLAGCGSGSSAPIVTTPAEPTPPVVPAPEPVGQQVVLEQALEHITINSATEYYVKLDQDAETLVINFAKGMAGVALNDPDLYVAYGSSPSLEVYQCTSQRGPGSNETCIIDKPKAGVYQILIDPYLQSDATDNTVKDGTLWASTSLLPSNRACNANLTIRGQAMSETDLDSACETINNAASEFHQLFANLSPAPETPVEGDLNEITGLTIFSSLTNHKIWMPYLNDSDNTSGIYFETAPEEAYHKSEIFTFNALEWTDGLTVYRSLAHEYVHALDGRYNKAGGYNRNTAWWTEGLAEYLTYVTPYERFENSLAETRYTLADIFQTHNNEYNASPYTWGTLAVAFFIQEHPAEVTAMLTLMRDNQWEAWDALLVTWAELYQSEFEQWLTVGPRQDFEASAKALELGGYQKVEGRGGWLFAVEVPQATDALTIKLSGGSADAGSMDVDMMVSANVVPHWSNATQPDCSSNNEGNEEICTFSNVSPGSYYITLDEYHTWAADIVDVYVSACAGTDCSVALPEPQSTVEAVDVSLPVEPPPPAEAQQLAISSCDLVAPYSRTSTSAIILVTNTTDRPVNLYWINHNTGLPYLDSAYATLGLGEEYTADYWTIGDRMMLADGDNNCLGVADLSTSNNKFVIDASLFPSN